ncbi:50S ribosomal protein L21, partial [Candidatus Parcubacteria bacterium]|nr:50S ribosomal protein L21 [Candidatus Parcubacteria bacterium]
LKTENKVEIGRPFLENVKVKAKILGEKKGEKIVVLKYKPRRRYRVKRGHRQIFTEVEIQEIITV